MTEFFPYEDLTWPEVYQLPRTTPLVIPLGKGYPLDRLASALDYPSRIGLLPGFPYGWEGSGLSIPKSLLGVYLTNLLDSLRDDGFSQVYALIPQGIGGVGFTNFGLGASALRAVSRSIPGDNPQPIPINQTLLSDSERAKVVIIPIGHTEQHGYHSPLSTDSLIIDAIAQGIVDAVPEQAARLPVMPYGVSTHRSSFAGTLNAGGRAFEDFWMGVIDHLAGRGFERLYFINGHGGNSSFLVNVIKYAGEKHRQIFCATAWLYLSGKHGVATLEQYRRSPLGGMGHACELETSLLLHLRPDLVHMDRVVDEMNFVSTPNYYMDWVEGGALVANPPWDDDTITGAYGAGSLATAEHGKIWLGAAIAEKVTHVVEIHEQQDRRQARRNLRHGTNDAQS